mmetsp:Transcript_45617/g.90486  ORF Transcript_45617/g.90486 Transcript_45617/m.90486 type:complete len:98 (-) Transcript_45617:487-780(-)
MHLWFLLQPEEICGPAVALEARLQPPIHSIGAPNADCRFDRSDSLFDWHCAGCEALLPGIKKRAWRASSADGTVFRSARVACTESSAHAAQPPGTTQ